MSNVYSAAIASLRSPSFFGSRSWRDQRIRADIEGLNPDIRKFQLALEKECRKYGIPVFSDSSMRSKKDQLLAKINGLSNVGPDNAPHCHGFAIHCIHSIKAYDLTKAEWQLIGCLGKRVATRMQLKVDWGGDWRNPYDPAHWQISHWRSYK